MASRSDIKAGSAFIELSLKDSAFIKGLRNAGNQLRDFGKGIATMGAAMAAAGASLLGPIVAGLKKFTESGEALYEMSQRTGITAKALAQLGYAAAQSGTDMGQVEGGIRKMQKFLGEAATGSAEARTELARLGLAVSDLQSLSPDQQFEKIGAKVAAISDPTAKAAAAMKIFGKSGTELIPLLNNLDAIAEAQRLGIGPSEEEVRLAHELSVNFGKLSGAAGAVVKSLGAAIAPMVNGMIPAITNIVVSVKSWIKQNSDLIQKVAAIGAVLVGAGTAIAALGGGLALVGSVLSKIAVPLQLVGSMFGVMTGIIGALATPFGIIAGLLGAGAYLWARYTDSGQAAVKGISELLGQLGATFSETFGGIKDALKAGDLSLAGSIAMAGLRVAMLQGINALSSAVGGELGDFMGSIGSQIASGDFSGAWSTVVAGMQDIWAQFSKTVVTLFKAAADAVIDLWDKVSGRISDFLQKEIESGSFLGKLLGNNKEVNDKIEANNRRLIADAKRNNEGREGGPQAFEGATAHAQASTLIDAQAKSMKDGLSALQKQAADDAKKAADKFHGRVAGGQAAGDAALKKAQDDLDRLKRQSAEEAKAAADNVKAKGGAGAAGIDASGLKQDVFGTFSAAALAAQGAGGNPMVTHIDEVRKSVDKVAQKVEALGIQIVGMAGFGA